MTFEKDIHAVVSQYAADFRRSKIEPLGMAGGMSGALFWQLSSSRGKFVLRRWPVEHPSRVRLRLIHDVLFHAAQRGIAFLPVPIRTSSGESFVVKAGYLWELAPWLPGAADYEQSPSDEKLRAAMMALARFHIAVSDFAAEENQEHAAQAPAISRRIARLHELVRRGTDELFLAIRGGAWPELAALAADFLRMIPKILPCAIDQLETFASIALPLQPCIRDIWHDHVLFTGNEVTGIIDFGGMDIDTPATDIARLLGSLVGDDADGWQTGMTAYATVRPVSADEQTAAKALDASGMILAGCNWTRWVFLEGRQFEDRPKIVERFRRIVARCTFALENGED